MLPATGVPPPLLWNPPFLTARLTQDLCKMIIDYIAQDEAHFHDPTLEACALTCRAWYTLCKNHLRMRVCITGNHPGTFSYAVDQRTKFPQSLPRLRHLPIRHSANRPRTIPQPPSVHYYTPTGYVDLTPLLVAPKLKGLTSIEFVGITLSDMHPQFFTSLSLFRSVKYLIVDSVTCDNPNLLFRFIHAFPKVTSVRMSNVRCIRPAVLGRRVPLRKLALSELTMEGMTTDIIAKTLSVLSLGLTSNLTIKIAQCDNSWGIPHVLDAVACFMVKWSAIQSLSVDIINVTQDTAFEMKFSRQSRGPERSSYSIQLSLRQLQHTPAWDISAYLSLIPGLSLVGMDSLSVLIHTNASYNMVGWDKFATSLSQLHSTPLRKFRLGVWDGAGQCLSKAALTTLLHSLSDTCTCEALSLPPEQIPPSHLLVVSS